jgi:dihydrofolate reductase
MESKKGKTRFTAIAALGRNRELGKAGQLIWRLPDDLKRFKRLTMGHPILMGRKTFESIGKPLPGRENIILTRDASWSHPGATIIHSPEELSSYCSELEDKENSANAEIFVIGGAEIYTVLMPHTDQLELTLVDAEDSDADTFFPEFESEFIEVERSEPREEDGISYQWVTYERK